MVHSMAIAVDITAARFSYTAITGLDKKVNQIRLVYQLNECHLDVRLPCHVHCTCDFVPGVLGFSQGACLLSIICALREQGTCLKR